MAFFRRSGPQYAEKLVRKGKIEAAIKEFKKILADDGDDTNLLNRIGDLYVRLSKHDDAVDYYMRTAEAYASDGFYVKAIAVYKKIHRIDPGRASVIQRLAELYERQGLRNDARTHYVQLAELHQRTNDIGGAVDSYRRVVNLDPGNPSVRLKLAELLSDRGEGDQAAVEYHEIAKTMLEHERVEEAAQVLERAFECSPGNLELIRHGLAELREVGGEEEAGRLLGIARGLNPEVELELQPEAGPAAEEAADEIELVVEDETGVARLGGAEIAGPDEWTDLSAPEVVVDLEAPAGTGPSDDLPEELLIDAPEAGAVAEPPEAQGPTAAHAPEPALAESDELDEVDLTASLLDDLGTAEEAPQAGDEHLQSREQDLLSEASVFLKYGLHRKSTERLEQVLELNPENLDAHRRLIGIQLEQGEEDEVLQAALAAREACRQLGDDEAWSETETVLGAAGYRLEGDRLVAETTAARPMVEEAASELEAKLAAELVEAVADEPSTEPAAEPAPFALGDMDIDDDLIDEPEPEPEPAPAAASSGDEADGGDQSAPADVVPPAAFEFPTEDVELFDGADLLASADAPAEPAEWLGEETDAQPEGDSALFEEEKEFFDLAAELQEELSDGLEEIVPQRPKEQSLEEIVEGFRKGVAENIADEDADTHYNLGIAYREMMLLDEAIGEFQISAKEERLSVDSCAMLGLCFREKGEPGLAVKWYRRALETPDLPQERRFGLLYELGLSYEALDDRDSAYQAFVEIYGLDNGYRDVVDKVQQLQPTGS